MSANPSITTWIGQLREGNPEAAQPLWERYFAQLVAIARNKLRGTSRRATDEEDVALSAFHSFCQAAQHFPRLTDREDLWQILVMLTARKAYQERRRQQSLKRGGTGEGRDQSQASTIEEAAELDQIIGTEPRPEFAVMVAEQFEKLLALLPTEELRQVARLRLEEFTPPEIATRLECTERTVQRRVALIRSLWEKEAWA